MVPLVVEAAVEVAVAVEEVVEAVAVPQIDDKRLNKLTACAALYCLI